MSDPRIIPADDAKVTLDAVNQTIGDGFSFSGTYVGDIAYTFITYVGDLAYTVIHQAEQIKRLQAEVRSYAKSYPDDTPYIHTRPGDLDPIGGHQ